MTPDESFQLYLSKQQHHGLPWQTPVDEVRSHFTAGWAAALEASRQTVIMLVPSEQQEVKCYDADAIYNAYPRKIGKQAALKAIRKAIDMVKHGKADGLSAFHYLHDKTSAYAAAVAKWPAADKQFVPHPATWFNRGSYDDDPAEWSRGNTGTGPSIRTVN